MGDQKAQNLTFRFSDFFDDGKSDSSSPKPCSDCGRVFMMNGLLDIHWQKVHAAPSLLNCLDCNVDFRRKMALIAHYRTHPSHRLSEEVKLIGCDICDAFNIINGFRNEADLLKHTKKVHGEEVIVNTLDQDKSVCPLPTCKSEFVYRKGMIEHLQILHGEHLLGHLLGITGPDMERLMEGMHFKCNYCSKVYRVRKSLNQHLAERHKDFKGENSPSKKSPGGRNSSLKRINAAVSTPPTPLLDPTPATKRAASTALTPPPSKVARLSTPASVVVTPAAGPTRMVSSKDSDTPSGRASDVTTSSSSSSEVTCPVCHKSFTRQSVLNVHSQMVHGTPSKLSPTNPLLSPSKVENSESLNPTTPPLKERMRLSSSSGVIQNIKKLVAGSSFQSRLNADEAMDVDVKPEIEKKAAVVTAGRGRPRKMIAVVQPPTAVLASKLKRKYQTITLQQQQREQQQQQQQQQQVNGQDDDKRSRTKRLPFKVRFNMESQAQAEPVRRNERRAANGNDNDGSTKSGAKAAASRNNKKYLESLFDEAYFANVDLEGKIALDFYGEEATIKEEELEEDCIIDGCTRKFLTYFSMMRHVAFHHRPARTARLMKLFD